MPCEANKWDGLAEDKEVAMSSKQETSCTREQQQARRVKRANDANHDGSNRQCPLGCCGSNWTSAENDEKRQIQTGTHRIRCSYLVRRESTCKQKNKNSNTKQSKHQLMQKPSGKTWPILTWLTTVSSVRPMACNQRWRNTCGRLGIR